MTNDPDDELPPSAWGAPDSNDADEVDIKKMLDAYRLLRPYLLGVFEPRLGWRFRIDRPAAGVFISLWEGGQVGFAFLISVTSSPYISAFCLYSTDECAFQVSLQADESEIRRRLGRAFYWTRNCAHPLGEYVQPDRPMAIVHRFAIYRDLLTPYLDRIAPRRQP